MSISTTPTASKLEALKRNLSTVIRGKDATIHHLVIALIGGGSVLIEDVPGVGKTTLAKALAASVDLTFRRVQCTPDLLPADIFGFSVFKPNDGTFEFRPGPIFSNLLLLDEINRASPRTQSAMLEAMAEQQVTIEGKHHPLISPFMVLATQNPQGFQGTFPLPESQLDRFMFHLSLDYPSADEEVEILFDRAKSQPLESLKTVLCKDEVLEYQNMARSVDVERTIAEYVVEIVRQTREHPEIDLGCSPRGSLMLFRAAQASAFVDGRDFVIPDDVQLVAPLVLTHRLTPTSRNAVGYEKERIVAEILSRVVVPV